MSSDTNYRQFTVKGRGVVLYNQGMYSVQLCRDCLYIYS